MTWATRFKLVFGTIMVLVIVTAATYVYTEREAQAVAQTATIAAETLPVGTDYGGKIVRQFVNEGDQVVEGDVLFTIDSLQRQKDLEQKAKEAAEAAEKAAEEGTEEGTDADAADTSSASTSDAKSGDDVAEGDADASALWTVTASTTGTVSDIPVPQGGYVTGGGIVADIIPVGTLEVQAQFVLNPRDLERLETGAPVELQMPDRTLVYGTVGDVEVATEEGNARAYVTVVSPPIEQSDPAGLTAPGTPVVVTVDLRDDGPLAGMRDSASDFLHRIGI
jgi:multidrug resistance efflux pump